MSKGGSTAFKGLQKCVECGSTRLTSYENDRIICTDCGFVITANPAGHNPDRSSGSKGREINDTNAYSRYHTGGDLREHDALGGRLRNHLVETWWNSARVSDATEKNLALAFSEITKIGDVLSLPKSVLEKAATTYKLILEKHCGKGRNIRTLSAAAVYMACKQCGLVRTLNEIARASGISKKKIGRGYKFLTKELNCDIPQPELTQYPERLLDHLTISEKIRKVMDKILEVADDLKLISGRNPMGIAAAACYTASLLTGERRTQREIAEVTHVTEATIRNRYKEISKRVLFTLFV